MWNSVADFFAMGGYAFYVWGSYGVVVLFLCFEVIFLLQKKRGLIKRITRMARANQDEL
jgi:heme exporter protein D